MKVKQGITKFLRSKKNGVKCIDINDFLVERGLRMERKK